MASVNLTFTIPGKPFPKARARVMRGGWAFTPAKTAAHERVIRQYALVARQKAGLAVSEGSFHLLVVCYGAHPLSDWDNLGKIVSDALNGVIWTDDRQVIEARVIKLSCGKGKERTDVTVTNLRGRA